MAIFIANELKLDFNKQFETLVDMGFEISHIPLGHTNDATIIAQKAPGFHCAVVGRENWNRHALEAVKDSMEFIARFGAGFDTVDINAATEFGIAVTNAPGMNARAVAEQALSLMLDAIRKTSLYDRAVRAGEWKATLSLSLEGVVGLLGFGAIAREVAKLLQPFPVKILAYDVVQNHEAAKALNVEYTSLDELVSRSNIISTHLPYNSETHHIVNKEFIAKLPDKAVFINTSRGPVVDENALYEGLASGKLWAVGLDVLEKEPVDPNSPLLKLPNVVLTPHASAVSVIGVRDVFEGLGKAIVDFYTGKPVKSILNPDYINHIKNK